MRNDVTAGRLIAVTPELLADCPFDLVAVLNANRPAHAPRADPPPEDVEVCDACEAEGPTEPYAGYRYGPHDPARLCPDCTSRARMEE